MNRTPGVVAALALLAAPTARAQLSYLDRLPPLVDREVFFGDAEIAYGNLSPDGRFVAFAKQLDGVLNVWVKGLREPFAAARPVTADTSRPIFGFFWSADSRYLLFVQDKGGDENFRAYAVDPTARPAPGAKVPAARDLTPYATVQARIYAVPVKTPNHILLGLNDRDPRLHDVYRVDLRTAERQLVFRNDHNVAGWVPDLEGNLRLATRIRPDGGHQVLRVDGDSLTLIYDCNNEETCAPFRFHKDGRRAYMVTDKGERDRSELVLLTVATGAVEVVESDPESQVDFGQAIFSEKTDELIATSYTGDRVRIYPRDSLFARDVARLRAALPQGDLFFRTPSRDDRLWIVKTVLDTDNGPNYLYDRATGTVELMYRPYSDIPTAHMASMRAVRYTARDGLEIPAYLTLPKGAPARNLAAVILPHGGPWGRDG